MIKVRRKLYFARRDHGRQVVAAVAPRVTTAQPGRIPRISRLMALAIHFDRLLSEGKARDQSELARLAHVTQPRMTQIMNLLHLAPDIQEELLHLPPVVEGRDAVTERDFRAITQVLNWREQRTAWASVRRIAGVAAPARRPPSQSSSSGNSSSSGTARRTSNVCIDGTPW